MATKSYTPKKRVDLNIGFCYPIWVGEKGAMRRKIRFFLMLFCALFSMMARAGTGLNIPMFANKNTSPAIHIKQNDTVCYVDLVPGTASGALNVNYNGQTYHAYSK